MLVVLFGLAGAGKTYAGKLLSEQSSFYFWDADEVLTDEMHECIREKRSFTQEMRDRYFALVIERVKELCKAHENVVITQAFYKNKNREQVLSEFPDSLFIQVSVELKTLVQRLRKRNNSVDEEYANKICANFEVPTHRYYSINNDLENNESSLVTQFRLIPELSSKLPKMLQTAGLNEDEIDHDIRVITKEIAGQQCYSGLKAPSGPLLFFSGEKVTGARKEPVIQGSSFAQKDTLWTGSSPPDLLQKSESIKSAFSKNMS
jgi:shikimate kinase